MKNNISHYKTFLLLSFLVLITIFNSCGSDDGAPEGQIIAANDVPVGIYNVIRYQVKGDCGDDGVEDLNPCQDAEDDVEICVSGTIEVIPGMLDVNGLVIIAKSLGIEFNLSVASISDAFEQSSIGPLSDLIIYKSGNDVYVFEGRDQSGCYGIISAEL